MTAAPEFAVTLPAPLLRRLRAEADRLGLPIEWLAAALVADTLQAAGVAPPASPEPEAGAQRRRPRTPSHEPIGRAEMLARREAWRCACA